MDHLKHDVVATVEVENKQPPPTSTPLSASRSHRHINSSANSEWEYHQGCTSGSKDLRESEVSSTTIVENGVRNKPPQWLFPMHWKTGENCCSRTTGTSLPIQPRENTTTSRNFYLKNIQGPMDNYSEEQVDQIIDTLPSFIGHGVWFSNGAKKVRLFANNRIQANQNLATIHSPHAEFFCESPSFLYRQFFNSTFYEPLWLRVVRDSSLQPNIDIIFYSKEVVYRTNQTIEPGSQLVANFKNLTLVWPTFLQTQPEPHLHMFSDSSIYENQNLPPNPYESHCHRTKPPLSTMEANGNCLFTSDMSGSCNYSQSLTATSKGLSLSTIDDTASSTTLSTTHNNHMESNENISSEKNEPPTVAKEPTNVPPTPNTVAQDQSTNEDDIQGFSCPHCKRLFSYESYLEKHLKFSKCVDDGNRKFPCHLCNRSFNKSERLRVHISHVHEQNRPYVCKFCKKAFTQSSSLSKHIRHHTGEKPYSCDVCGRAFSASSILRTHCRQHTGEKPFKCVYCGRAFSSHASLDSHLKRIHDEKNKK